ncbi:hypothetical protein Bbelb_278090 [Branchiostoma belcheri]|nr:hypothetical protein Bbelb_278090 [Branchiostoma belcheri]
MAPEVRKSDERTQSRLKECVYECKSGKFTAGRRSCVCVWWAGLTDHLLREFCSSIGDAGLRAGHGGHVGYIGTGGLFPSALGDFLAAAFNPYSAIESTSPGGVHMSNMLLKWMATLFGYPEGHAGNLTSGGTAATLIAMATARDARKLHSKDFHRAVVYVTKLTHHCYAKALNVIGMYHCIRREVPMDNSYRMDPSRLDELINEDIKNDLIPFMIIGTIGSTDVGTVDPVGALASIAERHGTWLHVDAAYGGFFSLCESTRHYFSGVERSDSIVVDPHKGLFLPYGTGVVLVREGRLLLQSNTAHSPGRLHKFTEALKGLMQSYPKVTVWDHRRLWRRNQNYFAPVGLHLSDLGNLQYYRSELNSTEKGLISTENELTLTAKALCSANVLYSANALCSAKGLCSANVLCSAMELCSANALCSAKGLCSAEELCSISVKQLDETSPQRARTPRGRTPDHLPRGLVRTTALLSTSDNRPPKRAPRLWLPLKLFGLKPFRSALEEKLLLAKYFYHKVKEIQGMTTLKQPDLSVVVFHYHDTSLGGSADDINRRLLDAILKDGRIFLSSTTVKGVFCLRICVLTFRTHLQHIDLCLSVIKECIDKLKV